MKLVLQYWRYNHIGWMVRKWGKISKHMLKQAKKIKNLKIIPFLPIEKKYHVIDHPSSSTYIYNHFRQDPLHFFETNYFHPH